LPDSPNPRDGSPVGRGDAAGWRVDAPRAARVLPVALLAVLGVAIVGVASNAALRGFQGTEPFFWIGVLTLFTPAVLTLVRADSTRTESVAILLITGMAIFGVRLLYGGGAFWGTMWVKGSDELLHYRTALDVATTGRLFSANTLLPVSPLYPGLQIVTNAVMETTGLGIVHAGLIVVGIARALGVLALFLFLERAALPARLAAMGTLFYMCAPTFLYQDALFLYEAPALALALFCLYAVRHAQLAPSHLRPGLNGVAALAVLAVAITHHMTSFILVGTLVLWTVTEAALRWRRSLRAEKPDAEAPSPRWFDRVAPWQTLPGAVWVPVLGVAAVAVWLFAVAGPTGGYVYPLLVHGVREIIGIITFQETGRRLFQSMGGVSAPRLEQAVGIASALLTVSLIPFGMWAVWKRHGRDALDRFLVLGALSYPAILALRFTESGWYAGSRAVAFVYVPLAFTVAAAHEWLLRTYQGPKAPKRLLTRTALAVPVVLIMFCGGLIAGNGPLTRMPSPYDPGVSAVPQDIESFSAATWSRETLGPHNRFASDWGTTVLLGSYGYQEALTASQDVPVEDLFATPEFGSAESAIVTRGRIEYVLVDRRIAGTEPLKGFVFEPWKSMVSRFGTTVFDADTIGKFDRVAEAGRIYDSGNIQVYDVRRTVR